MLHQFFFVNLLLLFLCFFHCQFTHAQVEVETVESFKQVILEQKLARWSNQNVELSNPPPCDPLNWYEVPQTCPGCGASVTVYNQIDCTTYNSSLWFTSTWPQPPSQWQFMYSHLITNIRLGPDPNYMDGVTWQQDISLEPAVDPLFDNNERWLWTSGGKSLIHEYTMDRIVNGANSTAYIFTAFSQIYSLDPSNPNQILSQGSVLNRIFYDPIDPTQPPAITTASQKAVYNSTLLLVN